MVGVGDPVAAKDTAMKEQLLSELVDRLRAALDDDLVSVVLHGSAVTGDFHEKHSNLNVLAVLRQIGPAELDRAHDAVEWWMKKKQPAPVLLSVEEVKNAHDAFAIEFLDIRAAYRILHGEDLVAGIEVEPSHHRHQVEHELRSRLLRLRGRYLALQKDRREVTALMIDSLATFATLFRHALLLAGGDSPVAKREVFARAAERFFISPAPFSALLDVREGKRTLAAGEVRPLFEDYLHQITRTAEFVDGL